MMDQWKPHVLRVGGHIEELEAAPERLDEYRRRVEPWLSAVLQSEHLNILLGSGLGIALCRTADVEPLDMRPVVFGCPQEDKVNAAAAADAKASGRGSPNIEDQINAALALIAGLRILGDGLSQQWESALQAQLSGFLHAVLRSEAELSSAFEKTPDGQNAVRLLVSLLLTFASRTASRERPHFFTTNYDRLLEYGCDMIGIRILDRFVGSLTPVFRASRLDIDFHYNPPGIRGEPRYLEGVVKLTKLHGSIDWRLSSRSIYREALPFGADKTHPGANDEHQDTLLIYPNAGKEMATAAHPYAELLRDFSSAICRPNSSLITYGYGYGDEHINRIISDMLAIPSTHLALISYDDPDDRIHRFCEASGTDSQISLLMGHHFGNLSTLVDEYLPKPAIDLITGRMVEMLRRRSLTSAEPRSASDGDV